MAPVGLPPDDAEADRPPAFGSAGIGARRSAASGGSQHHARARGLGLALGVLAAAGPMAWLRGFTVDDALISARMAHHLARGIGYRYNAGGPLVDAVTPLGYAHLLSPFARSGVLEALEHAQLIGGLAWLVGAGWLGWHLGGAGRRLIRFCPLLVLALSAQPAAWAVSGMESGLVLLLASLALSRRWSAAVPAALCAAWRPELAPWAVTLVAGTTFTRTRSGPRALGAAGGVIGSALAIALTRQAVFGDPAPLAALAKPSDLAHGVAYVLTGMLPPTPLHGGALPLTGLAWLTLAPLALRRLEAHEKWILVASGVHFLALVLVGGDWMVLHRLAVPVVPGLLLVAGQLAERAAPWATAARLVPAVCAASLVLFGIGPAAREVGGHRRQLVADARPHLAEATAVAALDVGWVGAATPGRVIDLAGVTDPAVALLPGGHTSKRIPPGFLSSRGADRVVLLLAPGAELAATLGETEFARSVEQRAAEQAEADGFHVRGLLPLGGTRQRYVVLSR